MTSLKYTFEAVGDAIEVLKATQVATPTANSLQPNDVLVRVKASSVNPADSLFTLGIYGAYPQFPSAGVGLEGSGDVVEVGSAVKDVKKGQRVHFYAGKGGAWAQYIVLDRSFIVPLPDNFSYEVGCQLTNNPLGVIVMLEEIGVKKGDTLLQTAAASAFGRSLIQFAKLRGVKTINSVRRAEQVEELKALGADYVINTATEDLVARVKQITNGEGVKFIADAILGPMAVKLLQEVITPGGVYVPYGVLDGNATVPVDMAKLLFDEVTIKGFWVPRWRREHPEKVKELYAELIQYFGSGQVTVISKTFDARTHQGLIDALKHQRQAGKNEKTVVLFN